MRPRASSGCLRGPGRSTLSENKPTLLVERVTKRYGDFTAVNDLSLSALRGRIFGLLGPNGAGKTTTIRMIVGITAPDDGRIELFGRALAPESQNRIGYLPEERGLYKKMKVGEQLRFFGELKGMTSREADEAAERWLARLRLGDRKGSKTDSLSKGMQQKIQFIATIMHGPDLLILDELFSGLDPVNVELMKDVVLELKSEGRAIIFSTHMMQHAEQLCDDICLINRSRKVLSGSLREVKSAYGSNSVSLRVEGGDGVLEDRALVASVKPDGECVEALLAEGADAQELLRRLVERGARVSKFERVEPSLHDIFIAKVGEEG
jgi:ABC-2 type transport system ATP-binding protein